MQGSVQWISHVISERVVNGKKQQNASLENRGLQSCMQTFLQNAAFKHFNRYHIYKYNSYVRVPHL